MKVAVVTPYHQEEADILRQAHDSVRRQAHPCHHVLVADGHPRDEATRWPATHIALAASHRDNGNTPRGIGAMMAACQGFDAIAFLDADNWFEPEHIGSLVELHAASGAAVCTSGRRLVGIDGTVLNPHDRHADGRRFVDTSCFLVTRAAFRLLPFWLNLPASFGPANDVFFLLALAQSGTSLVHSGRPTMAFRSYYGIHYVRAKQPVPPAARRDINAMTRAKLAWCAMPPMAKAGLLACHLPPAERDAVIAASGAMTGRRLSLNAHATEIEETQIRMPLILTAKALLSRRPGDGPSPVSTVERMLAAIDVAFPGDDDARVLRQQLDEARQAR